LGFDAVALLPSVESQQGMYALVGTAAVASAMLGAPISTVLIVFEMTGDYDITIAVMVAAAVSSTVMQSGPWGSFFRWQLASRSVNITTGRDLSLLMTHQVKGLLSDRYSIAKRSTEPLALQAQLGRERNRLAILVDEEGQFAGSVSLAALLAHWHGEDESVIDDGLVANDTATKHPSIDTTDIDPPDDSLVVVDNIEHPLLACMAPKDVSVGPSANIVNALNLMADRQLDYLPVIEDTLSGSQVICGVLLKSDLLANDADQASSLFDVARAGHVYSRISNPTVAVLEERVAALEGGVGAVCTASGMAAIHLGLTTLCNAGDHIVASRSLYGGTHNLLSYTLPRFGIETTFVDPRKPEEFAAAIRPETRVIFAETVANPRCEILDIPRVSAVAHQANLPLFLDATLSTPQLQKPLGCLVDGGRFDWEAAGLFPQFTEPYVGFHGMDFVDEFGPAAFAMRARKEGLRDFGAALSPTNAFYLLQGLETLSLRMERHVNNTAKLVEFLSTHEQVDVVHHPAVPTHPDHDLAKTLLPDGTGAVFSFEIKGGREAGAAFIDALRLFSHLANVGDAKSLVIHPASTTHSRMDEQALVESGIAPGLIRLSVGLEQAEDLIADLASALKSASRVLKAAS